MRIVIVPDTNIFMKRLELIKSFIEDSHPFIIETIVLKIVMDELDNNKKRKKEARDAIEFIRKNEANNLLLIEGEHHNNKMEIIIEYPSLKDIKTNDEKIISVASVLNHAVVLTSDKNMQIKARALNVNCVYVGERAYKDIKLEVMQLQTDIEPMDMTHIEIVPDAYRKAGDIIRPVLESILKKTIGPGYDIRYKNRLAHSSLMDMLDLIINDFHIFNEFVHRKSRSLLIKYREILNSERDECKRLEALQNILIILKIDKRLSE